MRKFILCGVVSMLISIQLLSAQSQLVNEMSNAVTELTGSFMDNPYHHSNTIKLYDLTQQFKKTADEVYSEALYSNHPQASSDLPYLRNMKGILKCLDFVVANIAGYSRGGIDAAEWEGMFHYIMPGFGWTYKVIHSTEDIVFYEYSKDNFKMVVIIMPTLSLVIHGNLFTKNTMRLQAEWFLVVTISLLNTAMTK